MKFDSTTKVNRDIIESAIKEGRVIKFDKNDTTRFSTKCVEGCGFCFLTSKNKNEHTLRIKTLRPHNFTGLLISLW